MDVKLEHLRAVPYLDVDALGQRRARLMPLWDGDRWHLWLPGPKGLIHLNPVDAVQINYVARQPASENDVVIPFIELMWQHASWAPICGAISGISDDFHNLGTSIEKLNCFFVHRREISGVGQFAKTELEYVFILSRSVFDLLHEVIAWIWTHTVRLFDTGAEARRKRHRLPEKFSKLVLANGKARCAEELVDAYAIPPAMAQTYADVAAFFLQIRRFRDEIVHLGKDPQMLFVTDRGFCVPKSAFGFGALPFWKPEHHDNENIISLLPLLAHVVLGTIESCGALMLSLATAVQLPPPMAPGYRVFVRGLHNESLLWLLHVAEGGSAWWSDRANWQRERVERISYFLWESRRGKQWWDSMSNWLEAERSLEVGPRRG